MKILNNFYPEWEQSHNNRVYNQSHAVQLRHNDYSIVHIYINFFLINILQNVQRRNATKLLLSKEDNKPTIQGWLTKVKNGHAKKSWCVLLGKMFLYFKTPGDQVIF